jgi:quinoprotein dehydrogenase-associated probable ABC transporter substrate-binding protein
MPAAQSHDLRVCADPNNLPFSNRQEEGFENKLARMVGDALHADVRYTWMPQRRGFIRRTLNAGTCDVVMGVPSGYEMVTTTKPYYRSTYVFVYRKHAYAELRSFDDPVLRRLKIGVHAFNSDGANTPPAHALAARGLVNNLVGYLMWDVDSVQSPAGRIVDAVAKGDIDVAIVWGPFGGYFAKHAATALDVVSVSPAIDRSRIPFEYDVSLGVREGDYRLQTELEHVLESKREAIRKLLDDYGVPLVADVARQP